MKGLLSLFVRKHKSGLVQAQGDAAERGEARRLEAIMIITIIITTTIIIISINIIIITIIIIIIMNKPGGRRRRGGAAARSRAPGGAVESDRAIHH